MLNKNFRFTTPLLNFSKTAHCSIGSLVLRCAVWFFGFYNKKILSNKFHTYTITLYAHTHTHTVYTQRRTFQKPDWFFTVFQMFFKNFQFTDGLQKNSYGRTLASHKTHMIQMNKKSLLGKIQNFRPYNQQKVKIDFVGVKPHTKNLKKIQ